MSEQANLKKLTRDWKIWAIVGFAGVALIAGAAFAMQANNAALGRQVHRNVTRFLVDHGSQVSHGIITGGMVATPMKTNVAVNSTIVSMLNNMAEQIAVDVPQGGGGGSAPVQDVPVNTGIGGAAGRERSPPSRPKALEVKNPSDKMKDDPMGWKQAPPRGGAQGGAPEGEPASYNADEFTPKGPKPPESALFDGDD